MTPQQLASKIDHTLLKPDARRDDVDRLCEEAAEYRFAAVCVNPVHVARAARRLSDSEVAVCAVAGFPLGASRSETKVFEARRAVEDGATEVDMVIDVGALRDDDDAAVGADIEAVVKACGNAAIVKVILENVLLDDDRKRRACRLAVEAGAAFVKTSTGFAGGGATVADVRLMSEAVAGTGVRVKAAGGIRNRATALEMLAAGADRLGASAGVAIVQESG